MNESNMYAFHTCFFQIHKIVYCYTIGTTLPVLFLFLLSSSSCQVGMEEERTKVHHLHVHQEKKNEENEGNSQQKQQGWYTFEDVDETNVDELEKINQVIFPITYPRRVYQDIVACGGVSHLARLNATGRIVGGISCRLENTPDGPILYIITLGVLSPYRNLGLGSELLKRCLERVQLCLPEVVLAKLHVQINNDDAIRFYEHHGFCIVERIDNYYVRVEPRHAVVLHKPFRASLHNDDGKHTIPGT